MNKPFAALNIAWLLALPASTFAASAVDLSIRGTITPSACETLLSGGGVIDFGKMSAGDLNADQFTILPEQTVHLSVRCEGATLFVLSTVDNRAGSSATYSTWHGLGMTADDEKLGGAKFTLSNPIADNVTVRTITSRDGGLTWVPTPVLSHFLMTAIAAIDGADAPIAAMTLDADIRLTTHIAPGGDLTLIDEIPIDGSATLQLKYL